jgi:ubiquinol-cytochrome c reductase cytochrome c subunit
MTALLLAMLLAQAPRASASPGATANAASGKDVYLRYSCWACHGYAGHGGGGPRLVPARLSAGAFSAFVRNPPTMPPYTAKVLSDAQLADVYAYLKTLPESPPPKSIRLLDPPTASR